MLPCEHRELKLQTKASWCGSLTAGGSSWSQGGVQISFHELTLLPAIRLVSLPRPIATPIVAIHDVFRAISGHVGLGTMLKKKKRFLGPNMGLVPTRVTEFGHIFCQAKTVPQENYFFGNPIL